MTDKREEFFDSDILMLADCILFVLRKNRRKIITEIELLREAKLFYFRTYTLDRDNLIEVRRRLDGYAQNALKAVRHFGGVLKNGIEGTYCLPSKWPPSYEKRGIFLRRN